MCFVLGQITKVSKRAVGDTIVVFQAMDNRHMPDEISILFFLLLISILSFFCFSRDVPCGIDYSFLKQKCEGPLCVKNCGRGLSMSPDKVSFIAKFMQLLSTEKNRKLGHFQQQNIYSSVVVVTVHVLLVF